ncbi:TPA: beta-propeller fold lactonase family protein, partial [Streptococcus pyogenes]
NSTEDFIIVAHQDSDNISLFRRNRKTGMLTLKQKDFYSPEGTCILPTL